MAISKIENASLATSAVGQSNMAAGVAGNGPAFSAYQSGTQTVSNNTFTKIQFQTEEFDTANCFDSSTNYRFTPNVAGYYQINAQSTFTTLSAYTVLTAIYKNGSAVKYGASNFASSTSITYGRSNVSVLIYMNGTTDYIEVYANQVAGSSNNTSATLADTYFQGSLVRAA